MLLLVRFLRNLLALALWPFAMLARALGGRRPSWVEVPLRARWPEISPPRPFWDPRPPLTSIAQLRQTLLRLRDDPEVEGVVFEIDSLSCGWAGCESIRELVLELRARGKRAVAFLPTGGGTREYFVASACDEIHMPPAATLFLLGLARELPYLRDALAHFGARFEVMAAGDYKSAGDMLSRRDMSPADRAQTEALLDTIWRTVVTGIAEGRDLPPAAVESAIDEAPVRPEAAKVARLIDHVSYEDELRDHLVAGRSAAHVRFLPLARWEKRDALRRPWRPLLPRDVIAVLEVKGPILLRASPAVASRVAAANEFVKAARAAHRSRHVCGVVVHVESGGGSALASDEMFHALERLRERVPVCSSFGDVAASGGYYLAMGSERVFARPTTITGSIGVVTGKLDLSGALERLAVGRGVVSRGRNATMLSPLKALTDSERTALGREIEQTYELFLERVARGRGRTRDEVLPLAGGRVWSGADARREGLVDDLGGLPAAIAWVRDRAGARGARAELRVVRLPPAARVPPLPLPARAARLLGLYGLSRAERSLLLSPIDLEAAWD